MSVITEEVIAQCVAKEFGKSVDKIKINSVEKTRGSSAGDGFACEIWRFDVKATVDKEEKDDLIYVAKVCPDDELRSKMMRDAKLLDCEVWFYKNLEPKLQALRKAVGLEPLKTATVYYTNMEDGSIVMENLKKKFGLLPKSPKGIPNNCIEKLLAGLAEFHATTYHYLQTVEEGSEKLLEAHTFLKPKNLFEMNPAMEEMNKKFLVQSYTTASSIVLKAGHQELSQAVKKEEGLVFEKERAAAKPAKTCKFKTLIHGDFWYNNVMVKLSDSQELLDYKMIDFQIVMLNSVAVDVQYFLAASANMDDKAKHLGKWLLLYHEALIKSLVQFGYQETLYPFADFMADFKNANYHALTMGLMHCNLHIVGSGIENPFEDPEALKGKSMEEASKMYMDFMDTLADVAQKLPGLVDRVVALTKEASENGAI